MSKWLAKSVFKVQCEIPSDNLIRYNKSYFPFISMHSTINLLTNIEKSVRWDSSSVILSPSGTIII